MRGERADAGKKGKRSPRKSDTDDRSPDESSAAWNLCTYAILFTDSEKLTASLVAYLTQRLNQTTGLAPVQVKYEGEKVRFILVRLGMLYFPSWCEL